MYFSNENLFCNNRFVVMSMIMCDSRNDDV
jgi:hypothetical protein